MTDGIVLQFASSDDPLSNAIKHFSRGWPSHVDAVLDSGELLGARLDGGVAIRPADYEKFSRRLRVFLPCSPVQEQAFYAFVRDQLGKPYDVPAIAAFIFGRDWRSDGSWFCSELQARALEVSKWLPNPLANAAAEITPRDLLLVVSPWMKVMEDAA
jgi:hypothetical protein